MSKSGAGSPIIGWKTPVFVVTIFLLVVLLFLDTVFTDLYSDKDVAGSFPTPDSASKLGDLGAAEGPAAPQCIQARLPLVGQAVVVGLDV